MMVFNALLAHLDTKLPIIPLFVPKSLKKLI